MSQSFGEPPSFRLGGHDRNFLQVEVYARSHPGCYDYSDGNWLSSKVSVQAGAFAGHYRAALRSNEFADFLSALRLAYTSLGTELPSRGAELDATEEQLSIVIQRDDLGHFVAKCVAMDVAGIGNRLEFEMTFDQSDVPAMLDGLETILAKFPVIGDPSH